MSLTVNYALTVTDDGAEVATRLRWPLFGRTATLNAAACCASVSSISAGQRRNEQAADATVDHYGSEGWGFESLRARPAQRPYTDACGPRKRAVQQ